MSDSLEQRAERACDPEDYYAGQFTGYVLEELRALREECARVADELGGDDPLALLIAAAIRKVGEPDGEA